MMNNYCVCGCFNSFKNQNSDFIKEFDHWILYLHFKQYFFGRSLLILKDHKTKLSDLSEAEILEFLHIYKKWNDTISYLSKNANYNCNILISNTEYNIHNNHLHWHFIPRYENDFLFRKNKFKADTVNQKKIKYNMIEKDIISNIQLRNKISSSIRKLL